MLTAAVVLLGGCGTTARTPPRSAPRSAPAPAVVHPSTPAPVAFPGWADDVVPAGDAAYVVGWDTDGTGALWRVGADGRLSARTAPTGMPGDPGTASPDAVFDLAAAGPRLALAVTGTDGAERVWVTDDGAHTWRPVALPDRARTVRTAVGGGAAYVLTSACTYRQVSCGPADLWSVDPQDGAARLVDRLGRSAPDGPGTSLAAYGDHVWALLDAGGPSPTALRSSDGGRMWQPWAVPLCVAQESVPASKRALWSTCVTGMLERFTRQVGDRTAVTLFGGEVGATTSCQLLPLSDTTAYAVVPDRRARVYGNRLDVTHDGGRTVTPVAAIPRALDRRGFEIAFVSDRVGYLVTGNGGELYRSADGGRHWTPVPDPRRPGPGGARGGS